MNAWNPPATRNASNVVDFSILCSWDVLGKELMKVKTSAAASLLLECERAGLARPAFLSRLYHRFSKLRRQEEHRALGIAAVADAVVTFDTLKVRAAQKANAARAALSALGAEMARAEDESIEFEEPTPAPDTATRIRAGRKAA